MSLLILPRNMGTLRRELRDREEKYPQIHLNRTSSLRLSINSLFLRTSQQDKGLPKH
jgi:hypothetical protein